MNWGVILGAFLILVVFVMEGQPINLFLMLSALMMVLSLQEKELVKLFLAALCGIAGVLFNISNNIKRK